MHYEDADGGGVVAGDGADYVADTLDWVFVLVCCWRNGEGGGMEEVRTMYVGWII